MFHWPILSAAIGNCLVSPKSFTVNTCEIYLFPGITSNLFFIALVCMLSWYQIIHSEEYKEFMKKKEDTDQDDFDDGNKKFVQFERRNQQLVF